METITNAASTVTSTVSNLIYGQQAKGNETAGQEPISGEQGKGTVNDPFDKGNTENPTGVASNTNTSASADATSKPDEFLKLDPTIGKPTTTESTTTNTGAGESSLPVVLSNTDTNTSNLTPSSTTGTTDNAGATDQVWKPSELDQVKPSGAPGAGPTAPEVTPAAGDTSSSPNKDSDVAKENTASETTPKEESAGSEQIDKILSATPKAEHSVPDEEANDPHSKMNQKTVRQTDISKSSEGGEAKDLATENSGRKSSSPSPGSGDEKSGKMSHLKEKLKDKLHISKKDK